MTDRDDRYGTVLREKMKESMEKPFIPLNRKVTRPTWRDKASENLVTLVIILGIVVVAMSAWWLLDWVESLGR